MAREKEKKNEEEDAPDPQTQGLQSGHSTGACGFYLSHLEIIRDVQQMIQ